MKEGVGIPAQYHKYLFQFIREQMVRIAMAQNIFPQQMPAVEPQEANDNARCQQAMDNPLAEMLDELDESVTVAAHQNQNEADEADEADDQLAWAEELTNAELLLYLQEVPLW